MAMRLEQLHYIVEVANQKSISKAAKNLYISQPSLSKAISQLEAELGLPIFVRLQQGIIPTIAGEQIISKAQKVLAEIADIKTITPSGSSHTDRHTLKVALPLLLCNDLLNHTLHVLYERYPELTILPYQVDNHQVISDLSNGFLDLGIVSYGLREKEIVENQLKLEHIFLQVLSREDFYLVASPQSPWADGTAVAYRDLINAQIATFSDTIKYNVDDSLFLTNASLFLPNKESLLKTLLDDPKVITIFPRIGALTDSAVKSGDLIALPILDFPNTQLICLLLNANQAISPYAQDFIQVFTDLYQASL